MKTIKTENITFIQLSNDEYQIKLIDISSKIIPSLEWRLQNDKENVATFIEKCHFCLFRNVFSKYGISNIQIFNKSNNVPIQWVKKMLVELQENPLDFNTKYFTPKGNNKVFSSFYSANYCNKLLKEIDEFENSLLKPKQTDDAEKQEKGDELPRVLIDLKHYCDKYGDDEIIFSYVEDYAIDILSALLANDDDKNILDWVQNIENIICNRKYNDNNLMSEIIMLISIGGEKYNLFFPFYETIIQKINAKLLELGIEMPKIIVKPLLEKDNFDKFLKANKEFEQNFKKMFDNRKCKTYLDISNGQHADNEPYQSDLKHGDEVELFLRDFLLLTSDRDKDSKHFCETQLNDAEFGWKTCKFDKYLKDFNTMELIENFVGSLDKFQMGLHEYLKCIFKFIREKGLREEFINYKIDEFSSPNPDASTMYDFHEIICKMLHNFSSYKLYLQGIRERGIKRSPTFLIKEDE